MDTMTIAVIVYIVTILCFYLTVYVGSRVMGGTESFLDITIAKWTESPDLIIKAVLYSLIPFINTFLLLLLWIVMWNENGTEPSIK